MKGSFVAFLAFQITIAALLLLLLPLSDSSRTTRRRFDFNIEWANVTRLCHAKPLLTVNGQYPGPTIGVHEGDQVEIKVTNLAAAANTTIHWHGLRQYRNGWADGPAYVTQCPIRRGESYTYRFSVEGQRGTLFWHAHHLWQRASVHGAFIIYPRLPYPFSPPLTISAEIPLIFGEWWNSDVDAVENEMKTGQGPNSSDAYTINGLPGSLYPCSNSLKDTFIQTVERGKTYMLRIINAALNDELFFAIADHSLTVVEVDAVYTKPFTTSAIMIAPGQTTTLLLTANYQQKKTIFPMAARPYLSSVFPFDNSTTVGFLRYNSTGPEMANYQLPTRFVDLQLHNLPEMEDHGFATGFSDRLRSLGSALYPCNVPKKIDKRIVIALSLNLQDCPKNKTCKGYKGKQFYASMNNQSFVRPKLSILEAYYRNASGVFGSDFPERPPKTFDYTGVDPVAENLNTELGTKVFVVPYGARIELVLQDTNFLNPENHPIHVHGHNFFIVGRGFGNFDPGKDPDKYNLEDPAERNTVGVPMGGWAAIRIKADNPGVWFMHCHLEEHTSWGLASGFIVKNGPTPSQTLLPPPKDLPQC